MRELGNREGNWEAEERVLGGRLGRCQGSEPVRAIPILPGSPAGMLGELLGQLLPSLGLLNKGRKKGTGERAIRNNVALARARAPHRQVPCPFSFLLL